MQLSQPLHPRFPILQAEAILSRAQLIPYQGSAASYLGSPGVSVPIAPSFSALLGHELNEVGPIDIGNPEYDTIHFPFSQLQYPKRELRHTPRSDECFH